MLFCILPDFSGPDAQAAIDALESSAPEQNDRVSALFCADDAALAQAPIAALAQTRLVFADEAAARASGLLGQKGEGRWVLLDPSLRVLRVWPLAESDAAVAALAQSPSPSDHAGAPLNAPVLIAPRIFEPEFCKRLIAYYNTHGGEASGITKENDAGKTHVVLDNDFKRRADRIIEDETLRSAIMQRIFWRLTPEIEKAFMWKPTRMERYLVACYDAKSGGFFRPHRDNTTAGTAHRRFAVTINLNADQYDGGDLRFPEFGSRTYRAPTGGAVVFSCALLHEATPVTRGQRYAFLPFLYDEAAAKVRAANNKFLDDSIAAYGGAGVEGD